MTALYQLTAEYLEAQTALVEADFDEQTVADTLDGLSGDLQEKAVNVAMFIRNLEVTAEAIKQAEKDMTERRKTLERKTEALKLYLKANMTRCGLLKIESPYLVLTLKKNPPSVIVYDAGAIPKQFMINPPAPEPYPDKKAIAEWLKAGEKVDGAYLEQAERLEIR